MGGKSKFVLSLWGALLLTIPVYIVFHELGHSIAAIACGAEITNFSIINAKMSYTGGNFNRITEAVFNASGLILPVFICLVFILTFKPGMKNMFYKCLYAAFFVMTVSSVFAWILVPIVCMLSEPPAGDDVAKFISSSQLNPFIIISGAAVLIAALVALASNKGIFRSFIELVKGIRMHQKNNSL